ncbi:MAG: ABC transporter permease subunit [Sedimentisphaerales bacterium]|nr:ABC transporter permease subunit [Sedimentisphaerales bacterium]
MLRTLIGKELVETVLDLRFVVVTVLFLVLIPLGMYVGRKDYERRLANYQREYQMYRQHYGDSVGASVEAQGFRPPSMLSVFALGLDPFLPDKAITSRSGLVRAAKEPGIDNAEALLFGKADFLFNVSFIVSLAALIFTFNRVSGEKERGTLRAMIANHVRRGHVLLAKVVANYIALLIPFAIATLAGLGILGGSPDITVRSQGFGSALATIVIVTFLFVLVMVSLGVCLSTFTYSSIGSIMAAFLVWVILVLGIPKISPMIAEVVYPIESRNVANLTQKIAREEIEEEFRQKKERLYEACRAEFGLELGTVSSSARTEPEKKAYARYDREAASLDRDREARIADTVRQIEQDYRNRRNVQTSVAVNLSRLSPISCYTYLVSSLSGTGTAEPDRFAANADRYQQEVKRTIYDNFVIKRYANTSGSSATSVDTVDGFDPSRASIPDMAYLHTTVVEALCGGWADVLLLVVFNVVFFAVAFVRFNKYDVR